MFSTPSESHNRVSVDVDDRDELTLSEAELSCYNHALDSVQRNHAINQLSSASARRSLMITLERAITTAAASGLHQLARELQAKSRRLRTLPPLNMGRCMLLELPAEIREHIWIHAVTEWSPVYTKAEQTGISTGATPTPVPHETLMRKIPIRMDRFNRPLPPPITRACSLTRNETLHIYYSANTFECWRPLFWIHDWSQSTFVDWLASLGPARTKWLRDVVLLYKHDTELEHDLHGALDALGIEIDVGTISHKQELSEYEMSFEMLGLPRNFGPKRQWDRWLAGNAGSG